jgi:hypothetical protein
LPPLNPALNPFDPEQIDLQAIVDYTTSEGVYYSQPVFGFFYQPFSRNTVYNNPHNEDLDDPDDWYWDELTTPYRFRFRWSSTVISHHSVRIKLNVPSMGHWEMEPFEFDSFWGDPRNSFVSVTENGHYFKTDDGHVYFPVGLNFNEATFGCNCQEGQSDSVPCSDCYEDGDLDVCCGIDINKKRRHSMDGISLKDRCLAAAAYVKRDLFLEKLQANGGNSIRMLWDPISYEIEFEKINNYYDRQYQAWEFDNLIGKCEELDIKIDWNHMIHYSLGYHWFGGDNWDWDNKEVHDQNEIRPNDTGYAYWSGCPGAETPIDFLNSECSIVNYKKKIRYMIARWGYSKTIYLMELLSEINNIGDGFMNNQKLDIPYDVNRSIVRPLIANWHNEIARYIKEDLKCTRLLIGADYTGRAPMAGYTDVPSYNPCGSDYFDYSWMSEYIDVICYNNYTFNPYNYRNLHRSFGWVESQFDNSDLTHPGFLCDNTITTEVVGFANTYKPVVNPETGFGAIGCDATGFIRDLVTIPFTGYASSGMSWDEWSSTNHWHWMGKIRTFLENEWLNSINMNEEIWIPGYQDSNNFPNGNDGHAEAVYLKSDSQDDKRLIGIVFNRTWNWYTASIGFECDSIPIQVDENGDTIRDINGWRMRDNERLPTYLESFLEIGSVDEPISIKGMTIGARYHIEYFDPMNLTVINEENIFANVLGNLTLESYPLLTFERPFVFFKAWRNPLIGDTGEFSQTQPEDNSQSINERKSGTHTVLSLPELGTENAPANHHDSILLIPTIASNQIKLYSHYPSILQFNIFDASGRIILQSKIESGAPIDISTFASGYYFVQIANYTKVLNFTKQ